MSNPTPPPWFTGTAPSHSARVYARRPGNNVRQIANCEQHEWIAGSRQENRANARLIAAAPFLLAACEIALAMRRQVHGEPGNLSWHDVWGALEDAVDKARA